MTTEKLNYLLSLKIDVEEWKKEIASDPDFKFEFKPSKFYSEPLDNETIHKNLNLFFGGVHHNETTRS